MISAFATVGLSTGITADLPPAAQPAIIAPMYTGRVGARHVIYPEADVGQRVAHPVTGKMMDFIEFDDGFAIARTRALMETHNKSLSVAHVGTRHGITVVGVKRRHQDFIHATSDTGIKPGDHLIVAGKTSPIEKFAALF